MMNEGSEHKVTEYKITENDTDNLRKPNTSQRLPQKLFKVLQKGQKVDMHNSHREKTQFDQNLNADDFINNSVENEERFYTANSINQSQMQSNINVMTANSEFNQQYQGLNEIPGGINLATAFNFQRQNNENDNTVIDNGRNIQISKEKKDNSKIVKAIKLLTKSENKFLADFELLCNKKTPEWKRYQIIFHKLGRALSIDHLRQKPEQQKLFIQANECIEQLIIVFTFNQSSILADLIHLYGKANIIRANNQDSCNSLAKVTLKQRDMHNQERTQIGLIDQELPYYRRVLINSQLSDIQTLCYSMEIFEIQQILQIMETYKSIQMKKFPTRTAKLGAYLKQKRQTSQHQKEVVKQNTLFEKTKQHAILSKPSKVPVPANDESVIITPRDTVRSSRSFVEGLNSFQHQQAEKRDTVAY